MLIKQMIEAHFNTELPYYQCRKTHYAYDMTVKSYVGNSV